MTIGLRGRLLFWQHHEDASNTAWIYISIVSSFLGAGYMLYRCYQDRLKRPYACYVQLLCNLFCCGVISFVSIEAVSEVTPSAESQNAVGLNLFFLMLQGMVSGAYCLTRPRAIEEPGAHPLVNALSTSLQGGGDPTLLMESQAKSHARASGLTAGG